MQHPGSVQQVSLQEAEAIIRADVPRRPIRMVIWHHFWRPAARDYRGERTMQAVKGDHVRRRRWRDVGYNWLFGPDGSMWTGRTLKWHGAHTIGHNSDSVGLGLCLNGDEEPLVRFPDMERAVFDITIALCKQYGLDEDDLQFHRDFARKSCPGTLLDRDEYRERLGVVLATGSEREWVRLKINDVPVREARLMNEGGRVVVKHQFTWYESQSDGQRWPRLFRTGESVRGQLEGLGYGVWWHPEQGPAGTIYAYGPAESGPIRGPASDRDC